MNYPKKVNKRLPLHGAWLLASCLYVSPAFADLFTVTAPLPSSAQLASVTLFVPTDGVPLSTQLVLAHGLREQIAQHFPEAIGQTWWTLSGCGVTFLILPDELPSLVPAVKVVWQKRDWDVLTVHIARKAAVQELQRWRRDPFAWLLWQARLSVSRQNLDPDQPLRVQIDQIAKALQTARRRQALLLILDRRGVKVSPPLKLQMPLKSPTARRLTVRLGYGNIPLAKSLPINPSPAMKRSHALWWGLTNDIKATASPDFAVGMVFGELLGGGTGSLWFQLLRGDKPLSYHAFAQWQLTPFGGELVLYAATLSDDWTTVRQRAHKLFSDLRKGRVTDEAVDRAKRLAELRHQQTIADPMKLSRALAVWLAKGKTYADWQGLTQQIRQISPDAIRAFCRQLPPVLTEVVADYGQ